jgi:hypothetical protein
MARLRSTVMLAADEDALRERVADRGDALPREARRARRAPASVIATRASARPTAGFDVASDRRTGAAADAAVGAGEAAGPSVGTGVAAGTSTAAGVAAVGRV